MNLSFYGYADKHETHVELDSDDTDYEPFSYIDYFMSTPFEEIIVISRENKFYHLWCGFDILNCFISSYIYALISTFEDPKKDPKVQTMVIYFESVFAISLLLNFIVEYYPDGGTIPVKNLNKIAKRYLKG